MIFKREIGPAALFLDHGYYLDKREFPGEAVAIAVL